MTSGIDPLKISLDDYIAKCNQTEQKLFPAKNEKNFKSGRRKYDIEEEVEDEILDYELNCTSENDSYPDQNYRNEDGFVPCVSNIVGQPENKLLNNNVSRTGYDLRLKLVKKPNAQREFAQNTVDELPTRAALKKKVITENRRNNRHCNMNHKYNRCHFNMKGYSNRKINKYESWINNQGKCFTKHYQGKKNRIKCSSVPSYNTNEQCQGINSPINLHIQNNDISHNSSADMRNLKITFDRDTPQITKSLSHTDGELLNNSNTASNIISTSAELQKPDIVGSGQCSRDVHSRNETDIQSLLGVSGTVQAKNISELAKKFLDFLHTGTQQIVHKPIYDMKIQKQIHDLQRKQLRYCKPGGQIVTGDGPGINNCKIQPNASGISLNCRFI